MLDEIKKITGSLEGIALIQYFPKDGKGQTKEDINKIHYVYVNKDGKWFIVESKPIGLSKPEPIDPIFGLRVIPQNRISVTIEEAIKKFQRGEWGSEFVERITLSCPISPGNDELYYLFKSNLEIYVCINAQNEAKTANEVKASSIVKVANV